MRITRQIIKQNTPVTFTYGDIQVSVEKTSNGIHYEEMLGRSVVTYSYCATHPVRSSLGKYYFYAVDCQLYGIRMQNHTCASSPPCPLNMYASASKKVPLHRVLAVRTYVRHHHRHPYPIPGVGVPAENGVRMNCRFYNVRTRSA